MSEVLDLMYFTISLINNWNENKSANVFPENKTCQIISGRVELDRASKCMKTSNLELLLFFYNKFSPLINVVT